MAIVGFFAFLDLEPPFSRLYDNSKSSWRGVATFDDGVLTLSDGRRLHVVGVRDAGIFAADGSPVDSLLSMSRVYADAVPADQPGRHVVTLWSSGWYCGNGLATWNPFSRDLPRYDKQLVLTADLVGERARGGE